MDSAQKIEVDPFAVPDPKFRVIYSDGTGKDFDLYEANKFLDTIDEKTKIDDAGTKVSLTIYERFDMVRAYLGYPTVAEAAAAQEKFATDKAAGQDPIPPLRAPSDFKMIETIQRVRDALNGLEPIKKWLGLTPNSSDSASSPAK